MVISLLLPASFLVSQSAVYECFNLQNGVNMDASYDYRNCIGLKVKPRRGDGLLFYSLFPNGTIDPVSSAGCQCLTLFANFFMGGDG